MHVDHSRQENINELELFAIFVVEFDGILPPKIFRLVHRRPGQMP